MWYEETQVVSPWSFKKVVSNFQPMFTGFQQHDSAELLSFVLDGLHEDLNRVKKKDYIELPDMIGMSDKVKADTSWKYHLARNQSIIVDLMHGQYKSTLHCPDCDKISHTFDPFMQLSLPIPQMKIETRKYYFIRYDNNDTPTRSEYSLGRETSMKSLRDVIAEQVEVDPWSFIIGNMEDNEIQRLFCRNRHLADIADDETSGISFVYEINPEIFESERDQDAWKKLHEEQHDTENMIVTQNDDDYNNGVKRNWIKVPLSHKQKQKSQYSYYERKKIISFQRILWLNVEWTLERCHKEVFKFLRFYFNQAHPHEEGEELPEYHNVSDEDAFNEVFAGMTEDNWEETIGSGDEEGDYSYALQIVNHNTRRYYAPPCVFCGIKKCENCPLPYSSSRTLGDILKQYEGRKGDVKDQEFVNDYYYDPFDKEQKAFEFEIFWNRGEKNKACIDRISRCTKHKRLAEFQEVSRNNDQGVATLQQCFDGMCRPEKLGKDNTWYCRNCKEHVQAKKKLQLYKLPPILFINLKRFKHNQGGYGDSKLEDEVNFPLEGLDLSPYQINQDKDTPEPIYDLYAVSNHYGNMGFGHYTAYGKAKNGKWYDFDDSHVSEQSPESVITAAAYNLFYKRRDFCPNDDDFDFHDYKNIIDVPEFIIYVKDMLEKEKIIKKQQDEEWEA